MKLRLIPFILLGLAAVSCAPKQNPDDPFAGAKWIGTSEKVLYADFLPQYIISADITLPDETSSASLLMGGNDPRLMDADLNIMRVANGKDESFVRVELDRKGKCLNVYRTGYTKEDVPGKVLRSLPVADSLLTDLPSRLTVTVTYSELRILLDGANIGQVNVGPLGHGGDYIAYPQLSDIGWLVEAGRTGRVSDIDVQEIRKPNAVLYHHDGMAEAGTDQLVLTDPSFGAMPVLRSSFKVKGKDIESATLSATARGIYEININDARVGEDFLTPGLSQYNKHHYYQVYDVTSLLKDGKNGIMVSLAEGWWSGDITFGGGNRNYFGDQLAFLARLDVQFADGSAQTFVTDPSRWEVTVDGPVVYASLFQGQVTDARRSLADAVWHPAEEMVLEGHVSDATFGQTAPRTDEYSEWQLVRQADPSPSVFTVLTAQSIKEIRPGVFVYDMGQNFAGIPSVSLKGLREGQPLRFRYAEVLYPDMPEYEGDEGMLMLENIRGAMAQDIYIASGAAEELFEPHFTQHGYRYLEITGVDSAPAPADVKGLVISSVQDFSAHYESSNPLVNRLWENIRWSMLGNFISIPTDCPQRNERMGWSGDLSVFSRTVTYLSDVDAFLTRHTQAIRDVQMPDGRMPDVAPLGGAFGGLLWGSAGITVPYEAYRQYADTAILELNYDAMRHYMTLIDEKYIEKGTGLMTQGNRGFGGLGDWLGPQNGQLDNSAIWDAYYIFDLQIMVEAARVLGRGEDEALFARRLAERKTEYVDRYLDKKTGRFIASEYVRGRAGQAIHIQSSYVLPLAFGIIEDEALRKKVLNNLVDTIRKPGRTDNGIVCPPNSLMTGFITTAWISKALSDNGRSDMAYNLLQQTSYPSWLYPVTQGATTIWERLDSYTKERGFGGNNSMNSFNHYSFGAVGQWLMAYSLGIDRDPSAPGFRHFVLHPEADPTGKMTWARGWYDTPYGRISSSWKRIGGKVEYEFTIPEGCSATLRIPGVREQELSAGHYTF
ncbi:MAG: family 78 glycoside hydrolase catalytic domain [Bacteroidales bacterium]|jgi:alpha-L-rhamnosidase|nr:family 78 glycoside hydrolase catalytic domain [Bacteroidales bacterium]